MMMVDDDGMGLVFQCVGLVFQCVGLVFQCGISFSLQPVALVFLCSLWR